MIGRHRACLALLAALLGCGGDGGDDTASPPSGQLAGAAGAAGASGQAGAPAQGGAAGSAGGQAGAPCQDTGQRPGGRSEMMGAFDTKRGRLVFFGGDDGLPKNCNPAPRALAELWAYDAACASFEQLTTDGGPGPRARGAAIYDEATDRLVVFGGRFRAGTSGAYTLYNEVWALDLGAMSWQQLTTTGTPPSARSNPVAVFSAATREMILHGGNTSTSGASFSPQADTWALHLDTLAWREIKPSGAKPKARLFHAAALDASTRRLFIYGGGGAGAFQGPFYGDLWALDLVTGSWESLHAGGNGAPLGRIWSTLLADGGKVVLFGGHDDGPVGNNNDTWTFDPATGQWASVVPPEDVVEQPAGFCQFPARFTAPNLAAPDRRSAQQAGFDPSSGRWLIFGGKTDCGLIDDVWSLDVASGQWSRQVEASIGEACLRRPNPEQCTSLCL